MILRSQSAQVSRWVLFIVRGYTTPERLGRSFLNVLVLFSLGKSSPYITRLLREGSEYPRIRNHNLFTSISCYLISCEVCIIYRLTCGYSELSARGEGTAGWRLEDGHAMLRMTWLLAAQPHKKQHSPVPIIPRGNRMQVPQYNMQEPTAQAQGCVGTP
jgi:hypothetical protein